MIEVTLRAFLTLFLALTGGRSKPQQARMARRAVLVAGAVLFFFALGGPWLLGRLGISMILVGEAGPDSGRLAIVFVLLAALAVQYVADGVRGLLGAR